MIECFSYGVLFNVHFDKPRHVRDSVPFPDEYIVGVAYGTTNPCVFLLIAIKHLGPGISQAWVEREYVYDSKARRRQKTDAEYADDMVSFIQPASIGSRPGVADIYIDPSAASFKIELERKGLFQVKDANNDVNDGIRTVGRLLHQGRLRIASECEHTIDEFEGYVWDAKKSAKGVEQPIKVADHCMDALRYALHTRFGSDSVLWTAAACTY